MLFKIFSSFFSTRKRYSYRYPKSYSEIAIWDQEVENFLPADFSCDQVESLFFAKVLNVIDGDTIIVSIFNKRVKIRLDSIDCPEDGQEWGDTAKYGLIRLIGGKNIYLEPHGLDSYNRTLATIFAVNTKHEWMNVNERMVLLGHAWVMRLFYKHLPLDRQKKLNSKENWARSKNIGLWQNKNPIPPWQWRKDK